MRSHSWCRAAGQNARASVSNHHPIQAESQAQRIDRVSAPRGLEQRRDRGDRLWTLVPTWSWRESGAGSSLQEEGSQSQEGHGWVSGRDLPRSHSLPVAGTKWVLVGAPGGPRSRRSTLCTQEEGNAGLGCDLCFLNCFYLAFLPWLHLCLLLSLPGFLVVEKLKSMRS